MSEPVIKTVEWHRTVDGLPDAFEPVLMVMPDGDTGAGKYINESRGWEYRGCSGGGPNMIKRRTPTWWAYWPQLPEVPT